MTGSFNYDISTVEAKLNPSWWSDCSFFLQYLILGSALLSKDLLEWKAVSGG
jgi:hypothetical protein